MMKTITKPFRSALSLEEEALLLRRCAGAGLTPDLLSRDERTLTVTAPEGATFPVEPPVRRERLNALWRWLDRFAERTRTADGKSAVLSDFDPARFRFGPRGEVWCTDLSAWRPGSPWENHAALLAWTEAAGVKFDHSPCPEALLFLPVWRERLLCRQATEQLADQTTAVILAGGRSSRMGYRPKHLLCLEAFPFWEHTLHALRDFPQVAVSVSAPRTEFEGRLPQWADEEPSLGPAGGLRTLFRRSRTPLVLVVPCDLPLLAADDLRRLFACWGDDVDAVVARSAEHLNPLVGLYRRKAALTAVEEALAASRRSAAAVLDPLRVREVELSARALFNVNTAEDYHRLSSF